MEPAIKATAWAAIERWGVDTLRAQAGPMVWRVDRLYGNGNRAHQPGAIVALANAALPDGHPGKLTRRLVEILQSCARDACAAGDEELAGECRRFAAAIESYLPPPDEALLSTLTDQEPLRPQAR